MLISQSQVNKTQVDGTVLWMCLVKTDFGRGGSGKRAAKIKSIGEERGEVAPILHRLAAPHCCLFCQDRHTLALARTETPMEIYNQVIHPDSMLFMRKHF